MYEPKKIKYAFTLVELIVVVTILAILATIWFVSYSWYLAWTRDANRIANIKAISDGLSLYKAKHSLPLPESDSRIEVKAYWTIIAYQWYVWNGVLETIEFSNWWKDPKFDTYFSYYLSKDKKYFQLMWYLEEEENLQTSVFTKANAETPDYSILYPIVYWDKLGILTDTNNVPIQEITSIAASKKIELDTTDADNTYKAHLEDNSILVDSWYLLAWILDDIAVSWAKFWIPNSCPSWFAPVPWNIGLWQPGFCVSKYEMSYDEVTASDVTISTDWNARKYSAAKIPVSMSNRLPVTELTQSEAIAQCKKIWAHLITNNEWMTIARNLEQQKENWSSLIVWNGYIYNWVTDNLTLWCEGKQNWVDKAWVTGSDCNWTNKNRLTLSNWEYIYDFSWNIWEYVNKTNYISSTTWQNGRQTSISWSSNWTGWDDDWLYISSDMQRYASVFWLGRSNWMWGLYYANWVADNVFIRWWAGDSSTDWWIFSMVLVSWPTDLNSWIGFRCSK